MPGERTSLHFYFAKSSVLFAILCSATLCFAGNFTVYGPQTYVRPSGAPVVVSNTFSVANANTGFTLHVVNGGLVDGQNDFVSSTVITVNGVEVVAPNDLNQNTARLDRPVQLAASNTISVEVRGQPGGALRVEITGVDNDAPIISLATSPAANAFGWNNTDVLVSFACLDQLSGIASCPTAVNATLQGANQTVSGTAIDRAGNSASAAVVLNIDKTVPAIGAQLAPAANAAGWNNSDVVVSFNCTDALSGVATCTAPVNVQSEGANQSVSGSAADKAGNTASTSATVNLDKTPPQITVSSPLNGATVSTSNLTVSGTVTDALSGLSAVTCNGTPASFSATDFQCGLSLVSGSNSILVQATDAAGNSALNTLSVTFGAVLDPPPTAVFVTPTKIAMLLSETRKLALVDELGRTIPATSWSVSDPALAMVGADGTVTPLAAGEVIVTGTFQTLSAQAQLFVTPGEQFEVGTIRWLVEPLPGNSIAKIFPGQAGTDTTSFMVETGSSGDVIRAFNQEGIQQWMYRLSATTTSSTSAAQALTTTAVAAETSIRDASSLWWAREMRQKIRSWGETGSPPSVAVSASLASSSGAGGIAPGSEVSVELLAIAVTDSGGTIMNQFVQGLSPSGFLVFQEEIIALDENGSELWRNVVIQGDQWFAVHPDGTVFIVEPDLSALSWRVTAKDGATGAQKFFVTLPRSGFFGGTAPIAGSPTIGPDGNFYLPFEKSGGSGTPDTLQVLRIKPDGSNTFTEIASVPHCGLFLINPREVIPVTDDKFLATYEFFPFDRTCLGSHSPAQAVKLSTAGGNVQVAGNYPLSPLSLTEELPTDPLFQEGDVVVGEEGVAFATDGQSVLAFDSETGSQRWLYQPPPFCANCFHGLRVDRALEGNQLLVKDIEKVGNEFGSVVTNLQVPLNSNGVPLSDPFAGYGPGSNTGIGALYPPSCYVSYIVTDPVSGLLTIIQPDFGGPNCGQGFGATMSSSSSSVFGPTPGLANILNNAVVAAFTLWFTPFQDRQADVRVKFEETERCSGFDDQVPEPGNPRRMQSWLSVGLQGTQFAPAPGTKDVKARGNIDLAQIDFVSSNETNATISRGETSDHGRRMTLTVTGLRPGEDTTIRAVNHDDHTIEYATLHLSIKSRLERTVKPVAVAKRDNQGNISQVPSRLPNATVLRSLLEDIFGKQVNVHFSTVDPNVSISADYDSNGDNVLEVPPEGSSVPTAEILSAADAVFSNFHCGANDPPTGCLLHSDDITPIYVRRFSRAYAGINLGSPFIQDTHDDNTELVTGHEIGHTLGLADICPGDQANPSVARCLDEARRQHQTERIMWHIDGAPGRCKLTKAEWDLISRTLQQNP